MKKEKELEHLENRNLNEYQQAIVNIYVTNSWMMNKYQDFLTRFSVTAQQCNILGILKHVYPSAIDLQTIKSRMTDKNSDVSRITARLFKKNMIERKVNVSNRRKIAIKLTETGLKVLAEMENELPPHHQIISNLSLEEVKVLNKLLTKIRLGS